MFIDGIYYGSRSAHDDLEDCPRMRLQAWDLDGTGYQPVASRVPLISGDAMHQALARVLGHVSGIAPIEGASSLDAAVEHIVADMRHTYEEEVRAAGVMDLTDEEVRFVMEDQMVMLEGALRGWVRYRMPVILAEYDVLSIENQTLFTLGPGVHWGIRMDAVLRRKADGVLDIMDYKGTSKADMDWFRKHENSDQTVIYLEALQEQFPDAVVGGMFYEGIIRGRYAIDTAKSSPFTGRRIQQSLYNYGYRFDDGAGVRRQSKFTNARGWVKFRVADELPVKEWLDYLELEGKLPELFVTMPPASPDPVFRAQRRQEIVYKEQQYIKDLQMWMDMRARLGDDHPDVQNQLMLFAPRNTERCFKYGTDNRCPFADAGCLTGSGSIQSLPEDDAFKPREPHHDYGKLIIPLKEVA